MRRLKTIPPPVLVDERKKKNKKLKRNPVSAVKKAVAKENKDISDGKTKMYPSLDACKNLNMSQHDIYEHLLKFKLSESELAKNHFPSENYRPRTLVDSDDSARMCIRCNEKFQILNGIYMSATQCRNHPRKATFKTGSLLFDCCYTPIGTPGCTVSKRHVTLQHGPRPLQKTASRRHIRKDLQNGIFGLDCEMSYTTAGMEVTRLALVNLDGHTVYDTYVKPNNMILDFNTMYSGVEKRHMENLNVSLDSVISILKDHIFENTILIGHALNNDLSALGLIHKTVIDTSVLYPDPNYPGKKRSLKSLAADFLNSSVQNDPAGHDCIEDARTALQLALLKVPRHPEASVPRNIYRTKNFISEQRQTVGNTHKTTGRHNQPLMEVQNLHTRLSSYPRSYDFYEENPRLSYGVYYGSPQYTYGF